jgi:hypothetical protein
MGEVVILGIGVEGGGATIYGRRVGGQWTFRQRGTAMDLDGNDDEIWRGWESEPVTDLTAVLPDRWYMWFPVEVHPEFRALLRAEYERAVARDDEMCHGPVHRHGRWLELLT